MEAMKNIFINAINGGNFVLSEMETKIDTLWVKGSLTESERNDLLELAASKANDLNQINVLAKIADLESRVYTLEHANDEQEQGEAEVTYPTWESGRITLKGEILWYDHDNDGEPSLFLYDGGRASTTLGVGKIAGWYLLDPDSLEHLATYYKGTLTPIAPESTEPAGDGE